MDNSAVVENVCAHAENLAEIESDFISGRTKNFLLEMHVKQVLRFVLDIKSLHIVWVPFV